MFIVSAIVLGSKPITYGMIGSVPIPYGDVEDIAQAALYLCSDNAKQVNGATLSVHGGMSAM